MITPRFQLCIIVSAAINLEYICFVVSGWSSIRPSFVFDHTRHNRAFRIRQRKLLGLYPDLRIPLPYQKSTGAANYTLKERGHGHRESDTPIKNLLGHGMGLGAYWGDSDDGDDDNGFTGGWANVLYPKFNSRACGKVHADTDVIAALDYRRYGSLNKVSKYCGKKVSITSGDTTITATVADACPTCINRNCLDLSEELSRSWAPPFKRV
ncbi:hypothetical protein Pst134EB_010146 [Puccinia striiformis f. sp. tritici]|nr:hypothetical protein Pst134EB_010146 [Puccinia striiformis f. sp. tritici]